MPDTGYQYYLLQSLWLEVHMCYIRPLQAWKSSNLPMIEYILKFILLEMSLMPSLAPLSMGLGKKQQQKQPHCIARVKKSPRYNSEMSVLC